MKTLAQTLKFGVSILDSLLADFCTLAFNASAHAFVHTTTQLFQQLLNFRQKESRRTTAPASSRRTQRIRSGGPVPFLMLVSSKSNLNDLPDELLCCVQFVCFVVDFER